MNDVFTKQKPHSSKRMNNVRVYWRFAVVIIFGMILLSCTSQVQQQAKVLEEKTEEPYIRVCLAGNLQNSILSFQGGYLLELEEARYLFNQEIGALNVFYRDGDLIVRNNKRNFDLSSPQSIVFKPLSPGSRFIWNGIPYSGELWFHIQGLRIVVVNKLSMEVYLMGVVPYEIPTTLDEYQEAVFAQTIAARSYALYRLDNPSGETFDVWGDTRDQVYQGTLRTTPLLEKAIANTRGIILSNSNQAAIAYFHSTCGGVLEVVNDSLPASTNGGGTFAYDLTDNEYNCKVSPYYRWVEVRSLETILWNLRKEFDFDSLTVMEWLETGCRLDIEITKRKPSGRVEEMNFKIEDNNFIARGFAIRRVLADQTGKLLPSNFFFTNESPGNWEKFYIIGAGAGHGKGMCQWGAIGLALKGYSHRNILGFYYPNLKMVKFY